MRLLIYFLFITVSFADYSIASELYIIELSVIFVLLAILINGKKDKKIKRLLFIDKMIFFYALFGLLSVVVGMDNLWESSRYYRANILTPTLIYISFRYLPIDIKTFKYGLYCMLPMILIQSALLIKSYLLFGGRQQFFEGSISYTISLAALFVLGAAILLFLKIEKITFFKLFFKLLPKLLALGLVVVALYLTFSRTSLGSFLMLAPITVYVWNRAYLVRLSGKLVLCGLVLFVMLLFSSSVTYQGSGIDIQKQRKLQHSSARLFNTDLLIQDLTGRFQMWGVLTSRALENPILGGGGSNYSTLRRGHYIASSHNMLISVLLVSGLPGMLLFILIILGTYGCFNLIVKNKGIINIFGRILWLSYSSLLMVAFTGGLGGGRMFLFYTLMGLIARLTFFRSDDEIEHLKLRRRDL